MSLRNLIDLSGFEPEIAFLIKEALGLNIDIKNSKTSKKSDRAETRFNTELKAITIKLLEKKVRRISHDDLLRFYTFFRKHIEKQYFIGLSYSANYNKLVAEEKVKKHIDDLTKKTLGRYLAGLKISL